MATHPWSERLLELSIQSVWVTFTVPAGKRAVVKCISAVNGLDSGAQIMAHVNGILVIQTVLPAHSARFDPGLHLVAYAGEAIGGYLSEAGGGLTISGYLLTEPAEASTRPMQVQAPGPGPNSEPSPALAG